MASSSHASLSPSSAHRWLTCSASVELCATLPKPESSRFAEEGTAAHEAAERAAAYAFGKITRGAHTRWVKRFKPEQGDADEMLRHAADYAELLESIASSMGAHTVLLEQRLVQAVAQLVQRIAEVQPVLRMEKAQPVLVARLVQLVVCTLLEVLEPVPMDRLLTVRRLALE